MILNIAYNKDYQKMLISFWNKIERYGLYKCHTKRAKQVIHRMNRKIGKLEES